MKIRVRAFGWRSALAAASLVVAVAVTVIAERALFDDATAHPASDGDTVRIAAQRTAEGHVRVALQQQFDGTWGERRRPTLNVLPASAPAGEWRTSSPLTTTGVGIPLSPLYCVIAHGAPDDYFWQLLRGYSLKAEADLGVNVRFITSIDGIEQAAAIDRCVSDGARVIAATLANPEAVNASLLAAKAAGVRIITFNSGAALAQAVGSEIHIALDERAVGRLAAETFTARGVSGDIGCVVHEAANVGLDERCSEFEATYTGGDVRRIDIHGLTDEAAVAAIADSLTEGDAAPLHGLFTLNGDTLVIALEAIVKTRDQVEQRVQVGSVGGKPEVLNFDLPIRQAHLLFTMNNMSEVQGYLITAALRMIDDFHIPAVFVQTTLVLEGSPFIFHNVNFRDFPEATAEAAQRVRELQDAADADEAKP
ncbi:MAG: substrate-binding domain-containing protein [Chloroflexi bacterium]|nr:substrate-binding domain-containing protein [Chloroflexota bacterium]MYC02951.1 substrate-binding domain-containing protein [Chloroflexota bacterium]